MTLESIAKQIYNKEVDNHPTIHCNRFPSWEELCLRDKKKYYSEARKTLL